MSDNTYNGWVNYETWCVNLWLTNEQGTYNALQEIIKGAKDSDFAKADELKDFVNELADQEYDKPTFVKDLLNGALSEVNWLEIIQSNYEQ